MSQKKEKYARDLGRRVTVVEQRLGQLEIFGPDDAFEEHLARARYTAECKENARNKDRIDRRMRRIQEAESATRIWKAVDIGALIIAIIVEIIAIAAVDAKAADPVPQEPAPANELVITSIETITHFENDDKNPPVLESNLTQNNDFDKVDSKIYDVPLDADLQQLLREACKESGINMSLALAVIWEETDYRNIIGDDGASSGYMQVQQKWHEDRMARLGVTDLMDPASNFRVGCDYLAELLETYPLANALAFYNSGDPALRPYCERVMDYMESLEKEGL